MEKGGESSGDDIQIGTGEVVVTVLSASNLAAKDRSGKSDPYVVLGFGSAHAPLNGKFYPKFKTRIIKQELHPVWNETFTLTMGNRLPPDLKFELVPIQLPTFILVQLFILEGNFLINIEK